MTTYVVDNGRDYSDHALYFVESKLPLEDVDRAVRLASCSTTSPAHVLGTIDAEVLWVKGGKRTITLTECVDVWDYLWAYNEDETQTRDVIRALLTKEAAL